MEDIQGNNMIIIVFDGRIGNRIGVIDHELCLVTRDPRDSNLWLDQNFFPAVGGGLEYLQLYRASHA